MTILVLVFAEVLPKTYAITRPDSMAMSVARPIGWLVSGVSAGWCGRTGRREHHAARPGVASASEMVAFEEEIRGVVEYHHSEGGMGPAERHRLVGALDLMDLTIEEVMIHRKNINMLDADLARGNWS